MRRTKHSAGFTLVEMLVSVALVLLLMTLFAQVFQMAGGSVSTQRGLMENDQRSRTAQILLKGDIDKRTFRYVQPWFLNERPDTSYSRANERRGYFYISENEVANDIDDRLSFTVDARITKHNSDDSSYYGRSLTLIPDPIPAGLSVRQWLYSVQPIGPMGADRVVDNRNQPEMDDARFDTNFTADSPAAEITYFVRNGNLYRRVLLLRAPEETIAAAEQPTDWQGNENFRSNYHPTTPTILPTTSAMRYPLGFQSTLFPAQNFWNDFDFSGHPRMSPIISMGTVSSYVYDGAELTGLSTLDQVPDQDTLFPPAGTGAQTPEEIAYPPNRFGHRGINLNPLLSSPASPPIGGQPREYATNALGNPEFFGTFTQEETSHASFLYPHLVGPPGTPLALNPYNPAVALTLDANRAITGVANGPRQGEDLLLSNVHAFDIDVWDETLQAFVDIGYLPPAGGPVGDFAFTNVNSHLNLIYGPNAPAQNRVFDTWYPFENEDVDLDSTIGTNPDTGDTEDLNDNGSLDVLQLLDLNGDGTIGPNENRPPYHLQKFAPVAAGGGYTPFERWQPYTGTAGRYAVGSVVFPSGRPTRNGAQPGNPFFYLCVATADRDAFSGINQSPLALEPTWKTTPTNKFEDGDLTWQVVDNRRPLKAIRITIRFMDPTTQQMRTLTLVESLVD
jgi:prepilin-type N-terminal cleavage/methylation domain-containing protein